MEYEHVSDMHMPSSADRQNFSRELEAQSTRDLRELTELSSKQRLMDSSAAIDPYRLTTDAARLFGAESRNLSDLTKDLYSDKAMSAVDSISLAIGRDSDLLTKALGTEAWDVKRFGALDSPDLARSLLAADTLKFADTTKAGALLDQIRDFGVGSKTLKALDSVLSARDTTREFERIMRTPDFASAALSAADSWKFATGAERIINKFGTREFLDREITMPWLGSLVADVNELAASLASIEALAPKIDSALFATAKYCPVEVYSASSALFHLDRVLDGAADDEEILALDDDLRVEVRSELESCLGRVDPRWTTMWLGACSARQNQNPDYVRHTFVSLRELVREVLHKLAPDAAVKDWSSNPGHYHNGRPTRTARIEYISRRVQPELSEFFPLDVKVMVALIDLLNGGTHEAERSLSDTALEVICLKVEATVRFLIMAALSADK